MLGRLALWALRRYVGGPANSWIFTSGAILLYRMVRRNTGRRELIDLSSTKPGDSILIEHLPISHRRQMRDFRRDKRRDKRQRKLASRSG